MATRSSSTSRRPPGIGVDELLESILLVAEVEELVANPKTPGPGDRARVEPRPGPWPGRHRARRAGHAPRRRPDRRRWRVGQGARHVRRERSAGRRRPVRPCRSRCSVSTTSRSRATSCASRPTRRPPARSPRRVRYRRRAAGQKHPMSLAGGARLEDIFAMVQRGEVATLNLVVKADVQGSLEALTDALRKLDQEHEEVRLSFVHRGVGGINESDVNLASVSNATVIGFNVRPDRKARELAQHRGRGDAPLRGHLPGARRRAVRARSACSSPSSRKSSPATPRCARCSRCRGSARSPVATCSTARSPAGPRCASCARAWSSGTVPIASLRRFKDDVREVAVGLRVRHRPRELPGPQAGRRHRDVRPQGDRPDLSVRRSRGLGRR